MAHPFKSAAHKNDPKWVRNLDRYVEKATSEDVGTAIRNYGGDKSTTAKAAYTPLAKGEDD